jgi:hypothetical protein
MRKLALVYICTALLSGVALASPKVSASAVAVKQGDYWGIIDFSGHWKLPPQYKSVFYSDEDGLFTIEDTDGRQGLADPSGEWVVQPRFDQLWYTGAKRLIGAKQGDCWGYVDRTGAWVIPPKFDGVDNFSEIGVAPVRAGLKYGIIDTAGRWVAEPKFAFVSNFNKNGIAFANTVLRGKVGLINRFGQWITQPVFDEGYYFGPDGWAAIKIGSDFGYIDERGRIAFQMTLDEMPGAFENGIALASKNGKSGFINRRGEWVIPPTLEDAHYPHDGLGPAKLNGKWGFVNAQGRWVVPPRYDSIGWFDGREPVTWAELDGKRGFLDRAGHFKGAKLGGTVPDERMALNAAGWAAAKLNGRWGVLNSSGRWLIPPQFDCVEMCWDGPPPPIQVVTAEASATCAARRED